jgi:hypothetical protein
VSAAAGAAATRVAASATADATARLIRVELCPIGWVPRAARGSFVRMTTTSSQRATTRRSRGAILH